MRLLDNIIRVLVPLLLASLMGGALYLTRDLWLPLLPVRSANSGRRISPLQPSQASSSVGGSLRCGSAGR